MSSYGETIRKIRLDKGISQKALYTGILSKSYAIEFEKGKHEISLKRIEQILDQLIVPLDEFLFIYRGYSLSEKEWFSARYAEYGNSNNLTGLYSLLKEYEHRKDSFSEIRSAEIRSRIRQLNEFNQERHYKKSAILVEDQLIIQQYLSNLESWTLHEIQLFANTLDFIDYQQKATYFKALTPSFEKYRNYDRGKQILCGFLTNVIYELIQDNELLLAEHLVNELHS
ncbi:helix-turn-helix domain-containing protein, partial [Carnobacterium sp.]|uniref:helix-turn-helix domain-containing protein n=1 Tax=Carnobacterium sp. TaxID=48221 RepID=UPI002FCB721B